MAVGAAWDLEPGLGNGLVRRQRGGGVAGHAAHGNARGQGTGLVEGRQERRLEMGAGIGRWDIDQDLLVDDVADDTIEEDGATAVERPWIHRRPRYGREVGVVEQLADLGGLEAQAKPAHELGRRGRALATQIRKLL